MKSQDLKAVGGSRPTDVELINHYLKNKMIGNEAQVEAIPEVDFLKFEPWDLPDRSVIELRDNEWYFFFEISSINGSRSKRATKRGFWKKTGKDREIKAPGSKETIGIKKTLVFHLGRVPNGVGTNWVIHEYHLLRTFPCQSELVLIKLKRNVDKDKEMNSPSNEVEHSNDVSVTSDMITEINTTPEIATGVSSASTGIAAAALAATSTNAAPPISNPISPPQLSQTNLTSTNCLLWLTQNQSPQTYAAYAVSTNHLTADLNNLNLRADAIKVGNDTGTLPYSNKPPPSVTDHPPLQQQTTLLFSIKGHNFPSPTKQPSDSSCSNRKTHTSHATNAFTAH